MTTKKTNKKTKKDRRTLVLLDAHAILHRAYHAMQGFSTKDGRPTGALYGFATMVLRIRELFSPDYVVACFDLPKPTFRHIAYEKYKGTRKETDDALVMQIKEAESMCESLSIPVYSAEGFEADDILGTICEMVKKDKSLRVIIASGDMDTMQLISDPGVAVFTLRKGSDSALFDEKAVIDRYGFSPEQIKDFKALAGDSSDNIVGVPGIGEKGATELITHFGSIESIYKSLKKDEELLRAKGIKERTIRLLQEHEEEAFFSKTLATIRRDAPISFTLPERRWDEALEKEKFEALCDKYEFRALRGKLREIVGEKAAPSDEAKEERVEESIDRDLFLDLQILAQLLDSESTNPDLDTIKRIAETDDTDKLRDALYQKITTLGMEKLYEEVEKPVRDIIASMEEDGICLDTDFLASMSKELHEEVRGLEKSIYKEAGEEFTINSPKQLSNILYEKLGLGHKVRTTKTGSKTTNAAQLESMKDEHAIIPLLLEYRELTKLLSTYIDTLPQYVKEDGRVHAHFVQTGSATGRFSCEDPNLQNLPIKSERGKKVRAAFVAGEGKQLISCDYAQIDLRSAAILSGDKNLLDIFHRNIDVHRGTAAKMFGVAESEVTEGQRRSAKAINFGILYGMGVNALKEGMGVTREEAQHFFSEYKKTFSRLMEYLDEVKKEAYEKGYTTTLLGRRRQVPLLKSPIPFMRAQGERIAINAPIQGTSADIIKLGMIDTFALIKEKFEGKAKLLVQIHDELVFEVDSDSAKEAEKELVDSMEAVLSTRELSDLPLIVGASLGGSLGTL